MKINQKIYPELSRIANFQHRRATPVMYVSQTFFDAASEMQEKFTEGDTVGDLLNDYYATILHGQLFIFLMKDGSILHGAFGHVIEMWHGSRCAMRVEWDVRDNTHVVKWQIDPKFNAFWDGVQFAGAVKMMMCFQKYSETQYKSLPPKGKVKDMHCKYKSEFDFPIGLLTESWYTESKQSNPFMVSRHLRMQRCGAGLKERKPIWIDTYWKDGYKRGAFKDQ